MGIWGSSFKDGNPPLNMGITFEVLSRPEKVHFEKERLIREVKGPVFGLTQFLRTESSLKMMKNAFYFKFSLFLRYSHFYLDLLLI